MSAPAVPFEPLTALAGGIVGGALIALLAWRVAWRTVEHIARSAHPTGVNA